ncbi:TPA: OB-fold nucleic acid binding domain-containing protein [archaeon]|nr:OB-fold nucleic acid binding domain-containing protein [Candidatus Undinarchaeales archaeon SRR5007147.bin71]
MAENSQLASKKVHIDKIVSGEYVESEGYGVLRAADGSELSRVRILGTIVDKFVSDDGEYSSVTLDDSTETIRAKSFKKRASTLAKLEVGDIADVTGTIREYDDEIYINSFVAQKIIDPNFELLRRIELAQPEEAQPGKLHEDVEALILKTISETGADGASLDGLASVLKDLDDNDILEAVKSLLHKGDLYEPVRGVFKQV